MLSIIKKILGLEMLKSAKDLFGSKSFIFKQDNVAPPCRLINHKVVKKQER